MNIVVTINGYVNIAITCCICAFIAVLLFRRSKLSCLNWLGLIQILFLYLFVGIAQLIGHRSMYENTNCNFAQKFVYSVEGLLVYNLAIYIGYRIFQLCASMAEFVRTGSLPTEAKSKWRRCFVIAFWALFVLLLLFFISENLYWLISGRKDWNNEQKW